MFLCVIYLGPKLSRVGKLSLRCVYWWGGRISICSPSRRGGGRGKGGRGEISHICVSLETEALCSRPLKRRYASPAKARLTIVAPQSTKPIRYSFKTNNLYNLSFACDVGAVPISQLEEGGCARKKRKKKRSMW